MRDPIDRLLEEHVEIMRELAGLRRAVERLERDGDAALEEQRPVLSAVARVVGTELIAHARREDDALFPALERVFGREGTPTGVMREEHRAIHAQAMRFRETLRELNEVEHPAIVGEGERLRALTTGAGGAAELAASGATILRLLDDHFRKEEDILFPMAREILSAGELRDVAAAMESLSGS